MNVRCPTCAQPSSLTATNQWRPFCSERCRMIDLGAWLDERYAIAGEPTEAELEESRDAAAADNGHDHHGGGGGRTVSTS